MKPKRDQPVRRSAHPRAAPSPHGETGASAAGDPPRVLAVLGSARETLLIRRFLMVAGPYQIETASTLQRARALLRERSFDALLVDAALGDGPGLDLVREADAAGFSGAVVVASAEPDLSTAEALRRRPGAEYAVKTASWPAPLPRLLDRALEHARLLAENRALRARVSSLESAVALREADPEAG